MGAAGRLGRHLGGITPLAGTLLAPSTWRDIASFGCALLARRYDDTRSA
jgi:hypothetical protein